MYSPPNSLLYQSIANGSPSPSSLSLGILVGQKIEVCRAGNTNVVVICTVGFGHRNRTPSHLLVMREDAAFLVANCVALYGDQITLGDHP